MEKYSGQCRIFLICESVSKVIEPVRSRCLAIRVSSPSIEDVASVLKNVARKENADVSPELCVQIGKDILDVAKI